MSAATTNGQGDTEELDRLILLNDKLSQVLKKVKDRMPAVAAASLNMAR